jgi:serine/threonine protein kinase
MAPEQLEGGTIDARTDLYALGAVLYECLAGHPPHEANSLERILYAIMNEKPTPLSKRLPEVSDALSRVVDRALARNPASRFTSVTAMAHALMSCPTSGANQTDAATTHTETSRAHQRRRLGGRRLHVLLASGFLVTVATYLAWSPGSALPSSERLPNPMTENAQNGNQGRSAHGRVEPRREFDSRSISAAPPAHAIAAAATVANPFAEFTAPAPRASTGTSQARRTPSPRLKQRTPAIDSTNPYEKLD